VSYQIELKRIYAPVSQDDGARVLVGRLWPRGKTHDTLHLTAWHPEAAPSIGLHRQYDQGRLSHTSLLTRYRLDLRDSGEALLPLMVYARKGTLTLLTSERRLEHSYLIELRAILLEALEAEDIADREPSSPPCYAHEMRNWL
jgi:uncharacterized protein YeaO (DUF488 family)